MKKNDRVRDLTGGIYGVVMNVHREAERSDAQGPNETTNTKIASPWRPCGRVLGDQPTAKDEG